MAVKATRRCEEIAKGSHGRLFSLILCAAVALVGCSAATGGIPPNNHVEANGHPCPPAWYTNRTVPVPPGGFVGYGEGHIGTSGDRADDGAREDISRQIVTRITGRGNLEIYSEEWRDFNYARAYQEV